jgi:HSP20 family protein
MALAPWRPFGELNSLRREMDRLLERFFGEVPRPELTSGTWEPRLDMSETKDTLTIKAEIPGLETKDLDVSVSGDVLTIKGDNKKYKD